MVEKTFMPASVGQDDHEFGDTDEALRQAQDMDRLLRDLATKQGWAQSDIDGLKQHLLAMKPEELAKWERGYREHVAVPKTDTPTDEEQALIKQFNGYEEAAEILRIVRGSAPVRAADAVPTPPGPRRIEDDGGISFRDVTVYQNPDGTFKIIETASNTTIHAAAPENFEREFTGRKGPERMRLVMRRGRPYWDRVRVTDPAEPPAPPPMPTTDDASLARVDALEQQLREVGTRATEQDQVIRELQRQLQDLTAQIAATPRPAPAPAPRPAPPASSLTRLEKWREGAEADPSSPDVQERVRAADRAHRIFERRARMRQTEIGRLLSPVRMPSTPEGRAAYRAQMEERELTLAQSMYKESQEMKSRWPLSRRVSMGLALASLGILGTATGFTTAVAAFLGLSKWTLGAGVSVAAGVSVGGLTWRQLKKQNHPRAGLLGALAGITTTALSWFGGRWLADSLAPAGVKKIATTAVYRV